MALNGIWSPGGAAAGLAARPRSRPTAAGNGLARNRPADYGYWSPASV